MTPAEILAPMCERLRAWGYNLEQDGDQLLWPNGSTAVSIVDGEIFVLSSQHADDPEYASSRLILLEGKVEDEGNWQGVVRILKDFKASGWEIPRINKGFDAQSSSDVLYADRFVAVYGNSVHAWLDNEWKCIRTLCAQPGSTPLTRPSARAVAYLAVRDFLQEHKASMRAAARVEFDLNQILNNVGTGK